MPLLVHCPTGCEVRVPMTRAGSVVRCPECKRLMQLRDLTPDEAAREEPIELYASFANVPVSGDGAHTAPPGSPAEARAGWSSADTVVEQGPMPELDLQAPDFLDLPVPQPKRLRFTSGQWRRKRKPAARRASGATAAGDVATIGDDPSRTVSDFSSIDLHDLSDDVPAESEFQFLAQFFASCIAVLGLMLILPSWLTWLGWSALPMQPLGSRWIYILIFLGALHLVYSIFLFQIHDRAALWSVAIFLLIVGCIQAIFTVGTLLDAGVGPVSQFLQLPPGEANMVTWWCFLHLCFAVLLCYLCGRQALRWKHIELQAWSKEVL